MQDCIKIPLSWKSGDPEFYFILFIYSQREGKGGREAEKHLCVVVSHVPPTGDLARNPGMCPDLGWNQRPFGSWADTQPTETTQPGQETQTLKIFSCH